MPLASRPTHVLSCTDRRDELGHSRTTVGLTRSRGVTVLAGPYRLVGMIQTIHCYYFTAHSDTWALSTEPFACSVPVMLEIMQLTWTSKRI